jgi:hypothetical protein
MNQLVDAPGHPAPIARDAVERADPAHEEVVQARADRAEQSEPSEGTHRGIAGLGEQGGMPLEPPPRAIHERVDAHVVLESRRDAITTRGEYGRRSYPLIPSNPQPGNTTR